jgi:hypothetical protein
LPPLCLFLGGETACGDLATWDRPIFLDKRSNRCQVASPVWRGSKKSSALLFSALHRFLCIALRLVAATCKRILANLGTSASLTVSEMELQFSTCEYGRAMLSAMMTGTHPNTTDSTIRGLHGAQPVIYGCAHTPAVKVTTVVLGVDLHFATEEGKNVALSYLWWWEHVRRHSRRWNVRRNLYVLYFLTLVPGSFSKCLQNDWILHELWNSMCYSKMLLWAMPVKSYENRIASKKNHV